MGKLFDLIYVNHSFEVPLGIFLLNIYAEKKSIKNNLTKPYNLALKTLSFG